MAPVPTAGDAATGRGSQCLPVAVTSTMNVGVPRPHPCPHPSLHNEYTSPLMEWLGGWTRPISVELKGIVSRNLKYKMYLGVGAGGGGGLKEAASLY